MAAAAAAALLDELMGKSRNSNPTDQPEETSWDNPEVCKYFLCGFCPHELFVNTRADLGACHKIHDDAMKQAYDDDPKFGRVGYEDEFFRFLQGLVYDVDRRIKRGHQRLALNSMQGNNFAPHQINKEDQIEVLTEKINELVDQAEELGCEGKVEEAQGLMNLCEQLKEERKEMDNQMNVPMPQLKEMEVCEVCGAFLIVGDAKQRAEEHLMGKQHMGYAKVRSTVEEFKEKRKSKEMEREETWRQEREEREKEREKEREDRRKRREEREKEREREREERRKSRHRSRSRERRRSRDRDRHRRSRSRERRRSRSRDRKRSRSRERRRSRSKDRRRSRSRERRHRSRSRDRGSKNRERRSRSGSRHRDKKHSDSRERDSESRRSRDRSRDRHRDKSRDHDSDRKRDRSPDRGHTRDKHRSSKDYWTRDADEDDSGDRSRERFSDDSDRGDKGSRDSKMEERSPEVNARSEHGN